MSTALTGPTADLGRSVRNGVEAAFREVNDRGGIGGHPLELIALDDGYEPSRTAPNMRRLIEEFKVLAVIGNVGAPCAVTAVPIACETKTPLFACVTGGAILRKTPPDRYVINYRAGLSEEVEVMVKGLVAAGISPARIGFFTQRDAYGDSVYVGGVEALKRHGLPESEPILHARYERNTVTIESGLSEVLLWPDPPEALILGAAAAPSAAIIRKARELGYRGQFAAFSFVDADRLTKMLGADADGVIVTQVTPPLSMKELPAVQEYLAAAEAYAPESAHSCTAFEGYLSARLLIRALQKTGTTIDREIVTGSLLSLGEFDLGIGRQLRLSVEDHQACHHVWPTVIRGNRIESLTWTDLKRTER